MQLDRQRIASRVTGQVFRGKADFHQGLFQLASLGREDAEWNEAEARKTQAKAWTPTRPWAVNTGQ
jgi:hypothetical protein